MKEIYKVEDIVYHWEYGKGRVTSIDTGLYPVICAFDKDLETTYFFSQEGIEEGYDNNPTLSFTPYDFTNGGFSYERPINVGDIVYVILYIHFPESRGFDVIMPREVTNVGKGYIFTIPLFDDKPSKSYLEQLRKKSDNWYLTLEDAIKATRTEIRKKAEPC